MLLHRTIIFITVTCLCSLIPSPSRADDDLHRFFTQMRSRFLFELAEGECMRRLATYKPQTSEHAEYTLELSETYSQHAKFVSGDEQTELWDQSRSVLKNLLERVPNHPFRLELEKQLAVSLSEQANYLRWLAQIRPYDESFRQQTLRKIETSIKQCRILEQSLNRKIQSRTRNPNEVITAARLRQLLNEVRFHYARAILDHLFLQKPQNPNRRTYLKQGLMLAESIANNSPHGDLIWKTQILRIDLYTQAALFDEVKKIFAQLSFAKMAAQKPASFLASHVRYLHTRNEYVKAAQELAEYFLKNENISGELYFVNILNKTTLWEKALRNHDAQTSRRYFERIKILASRCQQDLGGYWGFRCGLLGQNTESIHQYGPNLAPAVLKAQSLYSSNRLLDAATEYKSAFRIASRENQNAYAAEFLYLSASLFVQSAQFEAARSTLKDYMLKFPTHQTRPQAHLLYAYCLGQLYAKDITPANLIRYSGTLKEHRRIYQTHETFVEATWMLAQLEEQRQQIYKHALNLYLEIPQTHPRYAEAQVAVARCFESILNRLRATKQDNRDFESYTINQLGEYLRGFPRDSSLSAQQAEVLMRLSRILLNKNQPDYRTAEQHLKRVFDTWLVQKPKLIRQNNPVAMRTLQRWTSLMNAATQVRIVSLAGSDQLELARQLMDRASEIDIANTLAILDGLTNLNIGGTADFRFKMGRLQLAAAQNLQTRRKELSPAQAQKLDRSLAQAHIAMNKPLLAIAIYEKIYKSNPKDDRLLRSLAVLLFDCKTDDCQRRALVYWKKIGAQEKQGSNAWIDARYRMALCEFNLKNYGECRKILAVVRLLYPNSGEKDLRNKIENLLASAKRLARR